MTTTNTRTSRNSNGLSQSMLSAPQKVPETVAHTRRNIRRLRFRRANDGGVVSSSSVNTSRVRTTQSDLQRGTRQGQCRQCELRRVVRRVIVNLVRHRHRRGTPRSSTLDWTSEIRGLSRSLSLRRVPATALRDWKLATTQPRGPIHSTYPRQFSSVLQAEPVDRSWSCRQ